MKRHVLFLAAFSALAALSISAHADLLVDRGLPTANINNAAGSNRSNVAWADSETSPPADLAGDDFTLGGTGSYQITDIRVWTVSGPTGLSLVGGLAGSSMGTLSTSYTPTDVTYSDGSSYQTQSGTFDTIYQLDFAVNITATAGQTYDFFLEDPSTLNTSTEGPFLLASNAALSGSTQDGADNSYLFLDTTSGTVTPWDSGAPGGGWDKSSDIDVQVLGTATPLPASAWSGLALLGGLATFGGVKRLRRQPA